jgi:hypothetical protein
MVAGHEASGFYLDHCPGQVGPYTLAPTANQINAPQPPLFTYNCLQSDNQPLSANRRLCLTEREADGIHRKALVTSQYFHSKHFTTVQPDDPKGPNSNPTVPHPLPE